ncbi:MAG: uroporphyrinogen decarboxylase family protein [Phycisphaerae bacterium]
MTNRRRILRTIRGEEVDRFPVWLKMDNHTWRSSQPDAVRTLDSEELLEVAGCDRMLHVKPRICCDTPHATIEVSEKDGLRRTVANTPDGELVGEEKLDPYTQSWHPSRYMAERLEDLPKLRWLFEDTRHSVADDDAEACAVRAEELRRRDFVVCTGVGPGPLMNMVEHLCGPVAAIYHLTDARDVFEELLELMHADHMRHLRALLDCLKADMLWMSENTSTTLISPDIFLRYCAGHLEDYGRLILEYGVIPVHHMCGRLNALLEMIDPLPAMANEAYTTPPLGDVTLTEGRTRMPSKALIGGTNATLWMQPAETIIETVAEDIAACPDRRKIFLTSAGVLPAGVSIEKARQVTDGLKRL